MSLVEQSELLKKAGNALWQQYLKEGKKPKSTKQAFLSGYVCGCLAMLQAGKAIDKKNGV